MTRVILALALLLAPDLFPADPGLSSSLEKARREFASANDEAARAEAEAAPLAESVRELKAVENPWWWTRWRLQAKLSRLQESLDRLRVLRGRSEDTRQQLFLVLSAMEEELRSALNRELSQPRARKEAVQRLFSRKSQLDGELEAMGFGEGKPFPLVDDPGQEAVPLLRSDRMKALQARAIQLEAWSDTVKEDLRLVRRAGDRGALERGAARQRTAELEALFQRISVMIQNNERNMVSKN
jgi:hypothetical protein